ncbi:MAG: D-alanyl-D-alanine carboxypeptidase/D-alanyl-D-alanine-endopeptidase [Mycobacteriales bacterium]
MRTSHAVTLAAALAVAAGSVAAVAVRLAEPPTPGRPRAGASATASATTATPVASGALPAATASSVPDLLRLALRESSATPAGVAAAIDPALRAVALGARVSATVTADDGGVRYERDAGTPMVPASTVKLLTAAATLSTLGPDARIETKVARTGSVVGRVLRGDLVLVGGGDPTLTAARPARYPASARVDDLARAVQELGITRVTGRVLVDDSLFVGARTGPAWRPSYVADGHVAPVRALEVDSGHVRPDRAARFADPGLAAGRRFAAALTLRHIVVHAGVDRGRATVPTTPVASVASPPVSVLVERMLLRSDNDLAESLGRLVALRRGQPTSFAGAAAAVTAAVGDLGVPVDAVHLVDASGLSPLNRLTTGVLARVLRLGTDRELPALRPLLTGLSTAGFAGTLEDRFADVGGRAGIGVVRGKTGSLNHVSTLAAVVVTRSAGILIVVAAADQVPSTDVDRAAAALDRAVARLVACGCGAAG